MNIKKHIQTTLILIALILPQTTLFANNIQVSDVKLTGQNTTLKYTMVQFNISWENSWRSTDLENNWDAAWIFVKFRIKPGSVWNHASLNNDGHMAPAGSVIEVGFPVINEPFNAKTNPAVGVFLYRSEANTGTGDVNYTGVQLRWNYGIDGLDERDSIEVSVFAIEMVYIPEGPFYVGDGVDPGSNSPGRFVAGNTTKPFKITTEEELTIGNSSNTELWGTSTSGDASIGTTGTLPAEFPKGFQSFYIMKYELSQYMYKEYLNKLTRAQQAANVSATTVGRFMRNSNIGTEPLYRNGIKVISDPGGTLPREYSNNLNNDGEENDSADGQHIACNWLSFYDLMAFADWSGLRPFTELEYEKACRGPLYPIADEYAWRTDDMIWATGIDKSGMTDECATNAEANIVTGRASGVYGPMRCGCFANDTTNREQAGATFYGVMEMSGNLWEYAYSVGIEDNRSFNGNNHGDGKIADNGTTNVTGWPTGAGIRGGAWYDLYYSNNQQVSSRYNASYVYKTTRYISTGIRLARTQQKP